MIVKTSLIKSYLVLSSLIKPYGLKGKRQQQQEEQLIHFYNRVCTLTLLKMTGMLSTLTFLPPPSLKMMAFYDVSAPLFHHDLSSQRRVAFS